MLKAVFFDAAGTLIYLPVSVGEHYREVGLRFGLNMEAAALNQAFKRAWSTSAPRQAQRGPRRDDDKGWWRDLVARVIQDVSPTPQAGQFDLPGYFEAVYRHFAQPGVWAAFDDVGPALRVLRSRGLRLGVISNFDRRLYPILQGLGLDACFESMTISSEVGSDKPDPYIFQAALDSLRLDAAEAMHVGDDPLTDWGAEAAGLRVFRLQRPARGLDALLEELNAESASKRIRLGW